MKKISIVVPCYNEEDCVEKFYDHATEFFKTIENYSYEIIFVNDGSTDNTRPILKQIAEKDKRIKVINFSRNFGQQAAMLCGYENSTGDAVVEFDCDMQDPIEILPEMLKKWESGYKVVHGKRKKRKGESLFKKFTAKLFYIVFNLLTKSHLEADSGDFKLYDREVINHIISLPERDKYLKGLVSWVGYKQCSVEFVREERVAGKTKYSFPKLFNLATKFMVNSSNNLLTLEFKGGILLSIFSMLALIVCIVLACLDVVSLVAVLFPFIALLFGISFIYRGISNMYLGKVLTEVKHRPDYIIDDKFNMD